MEERLDVPENLDECREGDTVSIMLNQWAVSILIVGIVVSFCCFVFGIVSGVLATGAPGDGFVLFTTAFTPMLGFAVGILAASMITRVLFQALASIVYHTTVTARVSLLNASQSFERHVKGEKATQIVITQQPVDRWECSCGHINSDLKTVCSRCGLPK